jgi:predicted MFS family arabinose efflux permease
MGARSGFYLDALSFFISGALIFFIAKKATSSVSLKEFSQEIVEVIKKSVLQEIKDGVLYFIRNKDIRFTAGISFVLWSALGAVYVVLIVFVQKTLNSATKDLGLLIMFLGLGLFLGSLIYGRYGQRFSHYKIIFISLVLSGIMLAIVALTLKYHPYFFTAAALFLLLGLLVAPIMIASNTIIHNASDNQMLGKIFSSFEIIMHLGFLLFMFITSFLAEHVSQALILIVVSCVVSVLGVVNLIYYRKASWLN